MLTEERHHEILDLLNRRGAVTVIELTKLLKTSEVYKNLYSGETLN